MSMSTIIKLSGEMKRKREKKRFVDLRHIVTRHETVEIVIFTGHDINLDGITRSQMSHKPAIDPLSSL